MKKSLSLSLMSVVLQSNLVIIHPLIVRFLVIMRQTLRTKSVLLCYVLKTPLSVRRWAGRTSL